MSHTTFAANTPVPVGQVFLTKSDIEPATSETIKPKRAFVPPGFENLLAPQTTQVDVYYGGAYLLATLATFTPNDITFLDPAAVAGKIPDLLAGAVVERNAHLPRFDCHRQSTKCPGKHLTFCQF